MKKVLLALAVAATVTAATPAASITFPSLTTIYVGSGVTDTTGFGTASFATAFACANVSGNSTSLRILVLGPTANIEGSVTVPLIHGANVVVATQDIGGFLERW